MTQGRDNNNNPPSKNKSSQEYKQACISFPEYPRATPLKERLVKASVEISLDPPVGSDLLFLHSILCQINLPRSEPDREIRDFLRRSGDAWLYIQAGMLDEGEGPVPQPLPHGKLPRLIIAWLSTYALRHKTHDVFMGHNPAEFMRLLGIDDHNSRRYCTLREQMHALAAARMQLGFMGETSNPAPLIRNFVAWGKKKDSIGQGSGWQQVLSLSTEYYESLLQNAVPLDGRALRALKGSALSLDVYAWLAHRLHRINGRPVMLHWANLRAQFGQDYKGVDPHKDFKGKFLPAIRSALAVYPEAKVTKVNGGFLLHPSPPPIPYKGT